MRRLRAVAMKELRQVWRDPLARSADREYRVTNPGFEISSGALGPTWLIGLMDGTTVPTAANHYVTGNYPRYSNPEWDALIRSYAVTIPLDQRLVVETNVIKYLQDNLMDTGVVYSEHPQFASRRLVIPQENAVWSIETWDLR